MNYSGSSVNSNANERSNARNESNSHTAASQESEKQRMYIKIFRGKESLEKANGKKIT